MPKKSMEFFAHKLHDFNDLNWAVIDDNGAIVDMDGLLIRLSREKAEKIAAQKNQQIKAESGKMNISSG